MLFSVAQQGENKQTKTPQNPIENKFFIRNVSALLNHLFYAGSQAFSRCKLVGSHCTICKTEPCFVDHSKWKYRGICSLASRGRRRSQQSLLTFLILSCIISLFPPCNPPPYLYPLPQMKHLRTLLSCTYSMRTTCTCCCAALKEPQPGTAQHIKPWERSRDLMVPQLLVEGGRQKNWYFFLAGGELQTCELQ